MEKVGKEGRGSLHKAKGGATAMRVRAQSQTSR